MKILVIGCGSIGARHARNAASLGHELVLVDIDLKRAQELGNVTNAVACYSTYSEAFEKEKDLAAAIVALPTSLHVNVGIDCIQAGKAVFMEKPLATSLNDALAVEKALKNNPVVFMMAQSYRFHEGLLLVKDLLDKKTIGKIVHITYSSGQYLPDWHPTMDYRKEYAAQKRLGGGALLTSMSHLLDTVRWLVGDIRRVASVKRRISDLEIDVDDTVHYFLKSNEGTEIDCQTDFLRKKSEHFVVLKGDKGMIEIDLVLNTIVVDVSGKKDTINYTFDANKRYVDELRHFTQLVKTQKLIHDLDISAGLAVMRLMESAPYDAFIVLSAGTVSYRDTEGTVKYASTTYEDRDAFGILGGQARVQAAAVLAKQYPDTPVVVTSKDMLPEKPTHASVMAAELQSLGIDESRIILEERSVSSQSQISETVKLAESRGWKNIAYITNDYHIPRIQALYKEYAIQKGIAAEFIPAEFVLSDSDNEFSKKYEEAKNSQAFKDRLVSEQNGLEAIKRGEYGMNKASAGDKQGRKV